MRLPRWFALGLVTPLGFAAPLHADWRGDAVRNYIRSRMSGKLAAAHLPSFSRQTGLACSACHYQFLALTPLGRDFKLNGYTLTRQPVITEKDSTTNGKTLKLSPIPLVAAMVQASLTHTTDAQPGFQNDAAQLPQQLSVFLAGQVTSKVGIFSQFTYSGAGGSFGIDNTEIRYANKAKLGQQSDMIYGFTLNNNPSLQDLWNTTPAWGFPFASSNVAPTGSAGTVVDGRLAQQAVGLGAYSMFGGIVYAEFSVYRSALQGKALADSFAINGVAPYWRLALQKTWERQNIMVGTYGLRVNQFPGAVTGPTDQFTDIGVDAQFETKLPRGALVARGTWIHEKQTLDATFAAGGSANPENTLKTLRFNASYYPIQQVGVTLGYFQTTGTVDTLLYAPGPVSGSANGDPKTNGFIGEFDFNPWQNTRLGLQYVAYDKFNGGKTGYDGFGRRASGNNTLYLLAWVVF
jgi:hypothetical protein